MLKIISPDVIHHAISASGALTAFVVVNKFFSFLGKHQDKKRKKKLWEIIIRSSKHRSYLEESVHDLFVQLYGEHYFSWKSIKTVLLFNLTYALLFFCFRIISLTAQGVFSDPDKLLILRTLGVWSVLYSFLVFPILVILVSDFIAIAKTTWLIGIQLTHRSVLLTSILVVADAAANILIFYLVDGIFGAMKAVQYGGTPSIVGEILVRIDGLFTTPGWEIPSLLLASLNSVWIWLFTISLLLSHLLYLLAKSVSASNVLFTVEKDPMEFVGYFAALLVAVPCFILA